MQLPSESIQTTALEHAERLRVKIRQSVLSLMENPLTNVRADWLKEGIFFTALLAASTELSMLRMWVICASRAFDDVRDPNERQSLRQDLGISLKSLQGLIQFKNEFPDHYAGACQELQALIDQLA